MISQKEQKNSFFYNKKTKEPNKVEMSDYILNQSATYALQLASQKPLVAQRAVSELFKLGLENKGDIYRKLGEFSPETQNQFLAYINEKTADFYKSVPVAKADINLAADIYGCGYHCVEEFIQKLRVEQQQKIILG